MASSSDCLSTERSASLDASDLCEALMSGDLASLIVGQGQSALGVDTLQDVAEVSTKTPMDCFASTCHKNELAAQQAQTEAL
jgi:hypothetical protein